MLRKIKKSLRFILTITSSVLLILSFPGANWSLVAWIAFIPLFFALENQSPAKSFLTAYLCGIIFFLGTVYWLIHVTLPGMIAAVLYLALYFGLFGLAMSSVFSRPPFLLLIAAPCFWVTMEFIRSYMFTGFGWNLLGHSQTNNLPVIQIADFVGAYGVSFLIVMVNTAVFLTIKDIRKKKYSLNYAAIAVFLVFLVVTYGTFRLKNVFTGEAMRVAVIQGNIPQEKKWDTAYRESIIAKYERLTKEASEKKADLIIWPETSVPGFLESERDLFDRVKALVLDIKTPLLAGTVREEKAGSGMDYYNSAVLFAEDGRIVDEYDKIHLVPFGEYIPCKNLFSFVEKIAPIPIGDCSKGKEYKVFSFFIERSTKEKDYNWKLIKKVRFSCLICFEDIFPDISRRFVREGAGFLVNITNDAWYKMSSAPYQHVQDSIFRAVENRVNVVRAANTGVSCFIDQKGRIVKEVESGNKTLFVDGFAVHDIILTRTRTFYTVYGDIFAYLCVILTLIYIVGHRRMKWGT